MNDNSKLAKPVRSLTSLVRPKYSPGLLLQDDDLTAGVSYTRNLSRLMFRTLFGCGVLCGLEVKPPTLDHCGRLKIDVAKGVALSCAGDPIEVPTGQEILIDTCDQATEGPLWIAVRHIETCCVPRTAQCPPDDEEPSSACTRDRDGFELQVFAEQPPCSCGCEPLDQPPAQAPAAEPTPATLPAKTIALNIHQNPRKASPKTSPIDPSEKLMKTAAATLGGQLATIATISNRCKCTLRTEEGDCYFEHYNGNCACDCCDCDWIILAKATLLADKSDASKPATWSIDHSVRRFVRPVLMRDPLVKE